MQKFIEQIVSNLESNGFPQKNVSLPTEKMYEVADNKGLSFNAVLEEMKNTLNITSEIDSDKIIFSKEANITNPLEDMNLGDMSGLDKGGMFAKAQEMMSKMSPEEMQQMQDMVMNMSPEQKEKLMKQGQDMGLV